MAEGIARLRARNWAGWLAAAAIAAALPAVAGCGESESGARAATSPVPIERVPRDRWTYARARFNEMCAGCHTLADAGARGRRYNLDVPDLNEDLVRNMILGGGPGMPPFASSISYREYEQLSAYLMAVGGRREGDDFWQWQIALRGAGERDRPPGWPPRRYLSVSRYNP